MDDRHRHQLSVVAGHLHFGRHHIGQGVVGSLRLQPGIGHGAVAAHFVDLAGLGPALQFDHRAGQTRVGGAATFFRGQRERAGDRQLDRLRGAVAIGQPQQFLDVAGPRLDVQRIAGGAQAGDHPLGVREQFACLAHRARPDVQGHDFGARRGAVADQVERVVEIVGSRDLVGTLDQRPPRGPAGAQAGRRRHVHPDFTLHAVDDPAQGPATVVGDADVRDLGRVDRHSGNPGAQYRDGLRRGRADRHPVDRAALEFVEGWRVRFHGSKPVEVQRVFAVPADAGKLHPIDRPAHRTAAAHVEDMHHGILGAARGQAVGQVAPVGRGREPVDRQRLPGAARQGLGVDEQAFRAGQPLAHVQRVLVGASHALFVEPESGGGAQRRGHARRGCVIDAAQRVDQAAARADRIEQRTRARRVCLHPGGHLGRLDVLEVTVGVGHDRAEQGLGFVADVGHRRRRRGARLCRFVAGERRGQAGQSAEQRTNQRDRGTLDRLRTCHRPDLPADNGADAGRVSRARRRDTWPRTNNRAQSAPPAK